MKVAYCTGFWCTNIGNGFFSLGVEYALKSLLGKENVTIVSDLQTYTTAYGKRLYFDPNQLEYISTLDVDFVILAGPVISKYFLALWKDILLKLKSRGVGYMILSAGAMKLNDTARREIKEFFTECPPYALSSRDQAMYEEFGSYAKCAYNGICFSFFAPDYYSPAGMKEMQPYIVCNFDKIMEPDMWIENGGSAPCALSFSYKGDIFYLGYQKWLTSISARTDRFTDALVYALSILPGKKRDDQIGKYRIIRTDHRFHPHFRSKIYKSPNSYVADLPYGYLNLYANAAFTLSDRVHACAVTLAFGNSAMLFAKTERCGLLERVGAQNISKQPVRLDMTRLADEKCRQMEWLKRVLSAEIGI